MSNRPSIRAASKRPSGVASQAGVQFWRRLIFGAVHEAKRTHCGVPTGGAILQKVWIAELRPPKTCKEEWWGSFDCACEMLGRDPVALRVQLVAQIDAAWEQAAKRHMDSVIYVHRAMVLACAGVPTAISRQYLLPLVDEQSYEDVAGIDHGDQYAMYDQRELAQAGYRSHLTDAGGLRDNHVDRAAATR